MYGFDRMFWLDLLILLVIVISLLTLFNTVMRKWLKVEKKDFFSYNHMNAKHKKIDWTIRILFLVSMFLGLFINVRRDPLEGFWFLETWFLMIIFIVVSETVRAMMEWKHAVNKKDYIFTISQLVFGVVLLLSVFKTNFFGLM
ncbi:DUF4181 domain-containing protein [Psychrobacillus psychrodurans]|uniref:DUF4181 domain-containing protein n=1 Tax=Psychrobacillus psychrodurans TaxID=126157 RepID=A0A9X3L888_9BACI|nr:DUF4181 domain-containing protein [Psychrobacillus psychrodurans]MCZ8533198.1 DUF4181 domain-containing protein [Psychrobacillus psychrodurans]